MLIVMIHHWRCRKIIIIHVNIFSKWFGKIYTSPQINHNSELKEGFNFYLVQPGRCHHIISPLEDLETFPWCMWKFLIKHLFLATLVAWLDGRQCQSLCSYICPPLCPDWNISKVISWIAMEFCRYIRGSQKMNPPDIHNSWLFL